MTISLSTVLSFTDREIGDLRIELLNPPSPEMPLGPILGERESFHLGASSPGFVPTAITLGMIHRDAARAGRAHAHRHERAMQKEAQRLQDEQSMGAAFRALSKERACPPILLTALASVLAPIEHAPRPQRKVGSTNPNREAQKRQRAARKKQR